MEENKTVTPENGVKKPTYEELMAYCNDANKEIVRLRGLVEQLNDARGKIRIDWLFNIVNCPAFDEETVQKAMTEIKDVLFSTPEENTETERDNGETE